MKKVSCLLSILTVCSILMTSVMPPPEKFAPVYRLHLRGGTKVALRKESTVIPLQKTQPAKLIQKITQLMKSIRTMGKHL